MKIQTLKLRQFTVFDELDVAFCPGINVLIGANGTGKTHILKLCYSLLKGWNADGCHPGDAGRSDRPETQTGVLSKFNRVAEVPCS